MAGRRGRPSTPLLSREQVVAAAIAVADSGGAAEISMRNVAEHLDVAAMSLYHHIGGKDDLLDAVVDAVFEEIGSPPSGEDWRTAMQAYARAAHDVLVRHPWALGLMDSRRTPGPATLRHREDVLGCLRDGGLSLQMTAHAVALVDSYVHGFVLQQTSLPFQSADEVPDVAADIATVMPPGDFPRLEEMIRDHALQPGYAFADEFDWGLELLLDGLARRAAHASDEQGTMPA